MNNSTMTAREAHAILHPDTSAASIWENKMDISNEAAVRAVDEACLVACEALKNQIPKKPVFKESMDKYEDGCWSCPVCGGTVGVYDLRDSFCSDCGQKIDWGE